MFFGNVEMHNVWQTVTGTAEELIVEGANHRGSGGGEHPWLCRIPDEVRRACNPMVQVHGLRTAGVEIRLNMEGDKAAVTLLHSGEEPAAVETWHGSFYAGRTYIGREPTRVEIDAHPKRDALRRISAERNLPFDPDLTRVVLPHGSDTRFLGAEGDIRPPRPEQAPDRAMLCYGSSITQGFTAGRPSGMYAWQAAERLGVNLLNLGFGGGARMEPEMADHIAARDDWHFATLEMGINVRGSMELKEFEERVNYFVSRVSESHPDKYVFCIDIFTCDPDLLRTDQLPKVQAMRQIVAEAANQRGEKVVHLDGTEILTSPAGLTADLVHPSPAGMAEMAANLAAAIQRRMN